MAKVKLNENEATRMGETSTNVYQGFVIPKPVETKFSIKTWRDDLALIVEEKHLYVNMCVLACSSPVFDAMFSGDFKEKGQAEISLPGKKYDDFVEFLLCIYPSTISVTRDNVLNVLPLAHEYQVDFLESACKDCLLQDILQNETQLEVYAILEMACKYKLDQVGEKCIEIIADRPEEEFEEFESKFPVDVTNAIRAEMLQSLKTKYKDVFGHVQTSRALYQFLGCEAKQKDLVKSI